MFILTVHYLGQYGGTMGQVFIFKIIIIIYHGFYFSVFQKNKRLTSRLAKPRSAKMLTRFRTHSCTTPLV